MNMVLRIFVIAAGLLTASLAQAEPYPQRPIRLLVPFAAGSAIDIVARLIAENMAATLGQNVYVDDQPGAAGLIGMRAVAHSAPDGYTVLVANDSVLTMVPNLEPDAGYDPQKDFAPVARLVSIPLGLIANADFPAKNVKDLIALAKQQPGAINYASGGIGSPQHIAMELMMRAAGITLTHVPYRGITPAVADIIAGHVPLGFTAMSAVIPILNDSRIRLMGVSTAKRMEQLPDVPTISEAGVPGYSFIAWCAMFVPSNTPGEVVEKLNNAALHALADPDVNERLNKFALPAYGSSPQDLGSYLHQEYQRTGDLIRAANIKPQ